MPLLSLSASWMPPGRPSSAAGLVIEGPNDARGEATVRVDEGERLLVDAIGGDTRIAVPSHERPTPS